MKGRRSHLHPYESAGSAQLKKLNLSVEGHSEGSRVDRYGIERSSGQFHSEVGTVVMQPPPRHSFKPLLFAPPQGPDAMPKTLRPHEFRAPKQPALPNLGALDDLNAPLTTPLRKRQRADSHIRLKVAEPIVPAVIPTFRGHVDLIEAQDLLDELAEDQLTLSLSLTRLSAADPDRRPQEDPSIRASFNTMDARVEDLANVRDALAILHNKTIARSVHRAFMPDAPLAEYLRGIYAWTHAVVRALDELSVELLRLAPNWESYRWRIEEAQNFHFDELEESIDEDLATLFEEGDEESVAELAASFDELLDRARTLQQNLNERFG
jgi:hypothetical protein